MSGIITFIRVFFTARSLLQVISSSGLFYGAIVFYEYLYQRRFVAFPSVLLLLFIISSFMLLTYLWHPRHDRYSFNTEIKLITGPILLIPIYFLYFSPASIYIRPLDMEARTIAEEISTIAGFYWFLPILIIDLQPTPVGCALDLAIICTFLTREYVKRNPEGIDRMFKKLRLGIGT
jgi:hypothetical protein